MTRGVEIAYFVIPWRKPESEDNNHFRTPAFAEVTGVTTFSETIIFD